LKISLQTRLAQHYLSVLDQFNLDLFTALAPAFPKMKVLRFDGSLPGDRVEIELQVGPLKKRWTSLITERHITVQEAWFTDEGQELPAPLTYWRHQHLITHHGTYSVIHDLIEFRTGNKLLDYLVYPVMYAQFAMRGPVYQRIFGKA
jgi:ligand-binding SRPBCC domain-containing protein